MQRETRSLRRLLLILFNGPLRMTTKMSNKKKVNNKLLLSTELTDHEIKDSINKG